MMTEPRSITEREERIPNTCGVERSGAATFCEFDIHSDGDEDSTYLGVGSISQQRSTSNIVDSVPELERSYCHHREEWGEKRLDEWKKKRRRHRSRAKKGSPVTTPKSMVLGLQDYYFDTRRTYDHVRQEGTSFVMCVETLKQLQQVPLEHQGNENFYKPENIAKRYAIRADPELVSVVESIWDLLPKVFPDDVHSSDDEGSLLSDADDNSSDAEHINVSMLPAPQVLMTDCSLRSINSSLVEDPDSPCLPLGRRRCTVAPSASQGAEDILGGCSSTESTMGDGRLNSFSLFKPEDCHLEFKQPEKNDEKEEEKVEVVNFNVFRALSAHIFHRLVPAATMTEFVTLVKADFVRACCAKDPDTVDLSSASTAGTVERVLLHSSGKKSQYLSITEQNENTSDVEKMHLTKPNFVEAMLDVVDVWTETISLSEYLSFAQYVLKPIAKKVMRISPTAPYDLRNVFVKGFAERQKALNPRMSSRMAALCAPKQRREVSRDGSTSPSLCDESLDRSFDSLNFSSSHVSFSFSRLGGNQSGDGATAETRQRSFIGGGSSLRKERSAREGHRSVSISTPKHEHRHRAKSRGSSRSASSRSPSHSVESHVLPQFKRDLLSGVASKEEEEDDTDASGSTQGDHHRHRSLKSNEHSFSSSLRQHCGPRDTKDRSLSFGSTSISKFSQLHGLPTASPEKSLASLGSSHNIATNREVDNQSTLFSRSTNRETASTPTVNKLHVPPARSPKHLNHIPLRAQTPPATALPHTTMTFSGLFHDDQQKQGEVEARRSPKRAKEERATTPKAEKYTPQPQNTALPSSLRPLHQHQHSHQHQQRHHAQHRELKAKSPTKKSAPSRDCASPQGRWLATKQLSLSSSPSGLSK